jgi:hypothetical protein
MSNLILNKSVFIHIPKCAGTLIQAVLHRSGLVKHRYTTPHSGHLFLHQMPQDSDLFYFCFVRHPYTWWPSFWKYSKMHTEVSDFNDWVRDYGPKFLGMYTNMVKRYIGEDAAYENKLKMSFIGKVENINEDLILALNTAKEEFNQQNALNMISNPDNDIMLQRWQNKQIYKREINDQSKEIIYKTEKWIFDRFNYIA